MWIRYIYNIIAASLKRTILKNIYWKISKYNWNDITNEKENRGWYFYLSKLMMILRNINLSIAVKFNPWNLNWYAIYTRVITILTKIRGSMLWPVSSKSSNEANITTATSTILFHYPKIDFSFVLTKVSKLESRYNVIELKGEANIYVQNNQGPNYKLQHRYKLKVWHFCVPLIKGNCISKFRVEQYTHNIHLITKVFEYICDIYVKETLSLIKIEWKWFEGYYITSHKFMLMER